MLQIFYFAKYVPSHTYLNFKGITLLPAMTWHKQFAEESWCHLTNIFSDFSKIFCNLSNICCHKYLRMFRKDQKEFLTNKGLYDDQFGWMGVHWWKPQCGSFASKFKAEIVFSWNIRLSCIAVDLSLFLISNFITSHFLLTWAISSLVNFFQYFHHHQYQPHHFHQPQQC